MKIEELADKFRSLPNSTMLSGEEVANLLVRNAQKIGNIEMSDADKYDQGIYAPTGPGKASYPCPCCDGQLLMKATAGVLPKSGLYTRYRKCNECGKSFKTKEVII